jgi:hypothetical protein
LADQHAKWAHPSLATSQAQHDSIAPPPLQEAAAPVAFPITSTSGAVPCWTTAATIVGAASRAALPLVFVDAPVPVQFFGYLPMPSTTEAPPLAVVLDQFHSTGTKATFILI